MSDGGLLPWKIQKIISRGPPGDYSRLRVPLPNPPKGQKWYRNEKTGEWKLVSSSSSSCEEQRGITVVTGGVPMRAILQSSSSSSSSQQEDAATCATTVVIDDMPPQESEYHDEDDDELKEVDLVDQWEVLSESSGVFDLSKDDESLVSYPLTLKRTPSNSTLDSNGCGILGVDYVEHVILPTDTLQGICLAYRIHATRLRQVNRFSGCSLLLAPKKLIVPLSKTALKKGPIRVQDRGSKEYKIHAFHAEFPHLSLNEAKAYIELADGDLDAAIDSAKEDGEWERRTIKKAANGGQIRLTVNLHGNLRARGVGVSPSAAMRGGGDIGGDNENGRSPKPSLAVLKEDAISTKTVQPQDIHKMTPDDSLGVEMQSLIKTMPRLD